MDTTEIVSLLKVERERLDRAIQALEESPQDGAGMYTQCAGDDR